MPQDRPEHIREALRSLRLKSGQLSLAAPEPGAAPIPTDELPPGQVVEASAGEVAYVIRQAAHERREEWGALPQALRGQLPGDSLFMDIETTGLSPSQPLFLIGTMEVEGDLLVVRQFLARDYDEERAAIRLYMDQLAGRSMLVTFNGTTFDVPYIRTRAAANRLPAPPGTEHYDLLRAARRAWGASLPDCKLQTLERHLLGRVRVDDIPGSRVPEAYHDYVATGDPAEMNQILEHNFLDLVAMAEVVAKL